MRREERAAAHGEAARATREEPRRYRRSNASGDASGNDFSSPNVMCVNTTEDTVKNRLSLMGAVLVMSIAVACSNDEPVEQASALDPALTTIVSSEGTPPPVQLVKVPATTSGEATSAGGAVSAVGPGLSVSEALASDLDGPLLVNGFIVIRDGETRLCELLLESFPAQCGGASLVVEGFDPSTVDGLTEASGVIWSGGPMQLLGTIDGDHLVVEAKSLG
jgi:hypothetical protein